MGSPAIGIAGEVGGAGIDAEELAPEAEPAATGEGAGSLGAG